MKTYRIFLNNGSHVDVNADYFEATNEYLQLINVNEEGLDDWIALFKSCAWQYIMEIEEEEIMPIIIPKGSPWEDYELH